MIFLGVPSVAGSGGLPAGVLLVVVAVVPWPWGAEGYCRRLARGVAQASRLTGGCQREWLASEDRRLAEQRALVVPTALSGDAKELEAVLVAARECSRQSTPFATRATMLWELQQRRKELERKIVGAAAAEPEGGLQAYSAAITAIAAEPERDGKQVRARSARALDELIAGQRLLRAPEKLRGEHEQLQATLGGEHAAMSAYQSATRGRERSVVHASALAYEQAVASRNDALRALGIWIARPTPRSQRATSRPIRTA